MESIKQDLQHTSELLDQVDKAIWGLIQRLDLDPVGGSSPHRGSNLDVDLNRLAEEVDQCQRTLNGILAYQRRGIGWTASKRRVQQTS